MNAHWKTIVADRNTHGGRFGRATQPLERGGAQMRPAHSRNGLGWRTVLALALTLAASPAQTATTIKSFGAFTNITGFSPQSTLVQGPDGTLYGTASGGEGFVAGTLFKVQPDGTGYTLLKWFTNSIEGANPVAGLALADGVLYGTTAYGGSSNCGTVFRLNTDGTGYIVLKNFTGSDGANPYYANLVLSSSVLYGVTYYGGSSSNGTVFKLNTDGTGFSNLHSFTALHQCPSGAPCPYGPAGTNSDGANPNFALTLSGSVLYGTAENGGTWGYGAVFSLNTDGTGYTVLRNFTDEPDGSYPDGVLTLSGNTLYGTTYTGGELVGGSYYRLGTVFRVNTDGTGYAILKSFTTSDGGNPSGALPLDGNELYGTGGGFNPTVFRVNTDGTGFTVLRNLSLTDGWAPYAGLMLSGSVLYGTSANGGNPAEGSRGGTLFSLNTDGTGFTVLENFVARDGGGPAAGVTLSNGVLYGTTTGGDGPGTNGTVFALNTDGTGYTVLKNFANPLDGATPYSDLALAGGVLYGTTYQGGSSNYGTVFMVNTDGTGYTILKHFTGGADGATPYAGLTLSCSILYGTTWGGGSSNSGTLFQFDTAGTGYTVLHNFTNNPDGAYPAGGLTLSGGVLYGTTYYGGSSHNYYAAGDGTVFKVNTDGTGCTVLHNFTYSPDGAQPGADLTLSGSVLYGTTFNGGSSRHGTVFKLNIDGTGYAVLKSFTGSDGAGPLGGLVLVGSVLYGTTFIGGSSGNGTVFKLNIGGTGYSVLKNFDVNNNDGANPYASLTLSGSALYGTTSAGGSFGEGTVFKLDLSPLLTIQPLGNAVVLSWTNPAFNLQSAPEVTGAYTTILGATSPYTNASAGGNQFFRLIGN